MQIAGFILLTGQRHDQGSDIQQGRHHPLIEPRLEAGHGRRQCQLHVIGQHLILARDEHLIGQSGLIDRDPAIVTRAAADRIVAGIIGAVVRDQGIGMVIPAQQEHTDQRLIPAAG